MECSPRDITLFYVLGVDSKQKRVMLSVMRAQHLPSLVLQARIDLGDVQVLHTLGEGLLGRVSCALWHGHSFFSFSTSNQAADGTQVAVKVLHRHRLTESTLRAVVRKAQLELSLRPHPNIARLLGVAWSVDTARMLLVSEYCPGGAMQQALECGHTRVWTAAHKLRLAAGLASGLAFLHLQATVHGDLKPPNILLDATQRTVKISDFRVELMMEFKGTSTLFAAPEVLQRKTNGLPVDVWAFGCCVVCLLCTCTD